MKLPKSYLKASLSLVLTLAVTTAFSLRSFAAIETEDSTRDPIAQDCTGTLTVKGGTVTINGNAAQTGATVMSGSVISTGSGGAVVDLGPVGKVELGDYTTATIFCVGGRVEIRTDCNKTKVEVRKNSVQVDVTSPKTETLVADKSETYDGDVVASAASGVYVKVECVGKKAAALWLTPGLLGFLALIGVGAGVAVGIGVGEGDISRPPVSPVVP